MTGRYLQLFVTIIVSGIAEWLEKRRLKRKLREGLGHEVGDIELTSLSTWMKMPSKKLNRPTSRVQPPAGGE